MFSIGERMGLIALRNASKGSLLAWIHCGLISGYTARLAVYDGNNSLDTFLVTERYCTQLCLSEIGKINLIYCHSDACETERSIEDPTIGTVNRCPLP